MGRYACAERYGECKDVWASALVSCRERALSGKTPPVRADPQPQWRRGEYRVDLNRDADARADGGHVDERGACVE